MKDPTPSSDPVLDERIVALLTGVAPDVDPGGIAPDLDFRDQFDFDSMDLLRFASALHEHFAIDIPERDYRQIASLAKCRSYLASRIATAKQE